MRIHPLTLSRLILRHATSSLLDQLAVLTNISQLHEVRAKALVSAEFLKEILNSLSKDESGNNYLKVVKCASDFAIASRNTEHLAMINDRIGPALRSVWELETIEFRIHTSAGIWDSAQRERKPGKKKLYIAVSINIYGDSSIQNQVGTSLSSAQLYLQHPDFLETGCEYDNPHFVSIPGVRPSLASSSPDKKKSRATSKFSPEPESDQNNFQNEIAVVFNSLTRAKCLKRLEADMRIKTPLLRYVYLHLKRSLNTNGGGSIIHFI